MACIVEKDLRRPVTGSWVWFRYPVNQVSCGRYPLASNVGVMCRCHPKALQSNLRPMPPLFLPYFFPIVYEMEVIWRDDMEMRKRLDAAQVEMRWR